MFSFPIQILPADIAAETAALNAKLAKGINNLTNLTDDDIDIGSTPKDVIFEQDGIKVYHYHALVEPSKIMKTPLLIVPPLINGYEVADLQPDLTLIFDAPVEIAQKRLQAGTPNPDRFEQEHAAFFERVRAAYLRIARENPARVRVVDATRAPAEINKELEIIIATI